MSVFANTFISFLMKIVGMNDEKTAKIINNLVQKDIFLPSDMNEKTNVSLFAVIISVGNLKLLEDSYVRLPIIQRTKILNLEDNEGGRPLDRAYLLSVDNPDREKIIAFLLRLNASIGYAAINHFISRGNLGMIKVICEKHSVDFSALNFEDKTPLMIAAENGELEIIKFLVEEKGVDPSVKNKEGETAYDIAMLNKEYSVAEYLERKMMVKSF
jgi:hypothetical protein